MSGLCKASSAAEASGLTFGGMWSPIGIRRSAYNIQNGANICSVELAKQHNQQLAAPYTSLTKNKRRIRHSRDDRGKLGGRRVLVNRHFVERNFQIL